MSDTGLALTTAHFYTPSGRLIQRDYTNKSFYDYYFHKDDNARNPLDVKMTDSGRTVYGGGGITPDEKYADAEARRPAGRAAARRAVQLYPATTSRKHASTNLPKGWMPDANVVEDLHDYLLKQRRQVHRSRFHEGP